MNESMNQLATLLSGAQAPEAPFPPNSRYVNTPLATWTGPDNVTITYLRRRFVPQPESFATTAIHRVVQDERPDLLAARYYGDPEAYWRLCDANGVMRPEELTEVVGQRVRIGVAAGMPGEGND